MSDSLPKETNIGHGHVFPRPDGIKARCGGPGMCAECSRDLARKNATPHASDCAMNNAPALQPGSCDCGAEAPVPSKEQTPEIREIVEWSPGTNPVVRKFVPLEDYERLTELLRICEAKAIPPDETGARLEVAGHDDALSKIATHVREIEILCDAMGYDPYEWLADPPSASPEETSEELSCQTCGKPLDDHGGMGLPCPLSAPPEKASENPHPNVAGRQAYAAYVDAQGVHSNRFPAWHELSQETRDNWIRRAVNG